MNLPSVIYAGHLSYGVTWDEASWAKVTPADENRLANTDHANEIISIKPGVSDAMARSLLWHEALHAVFFAILGQPDWLGLGPNRFEREEAVVSRIEFATLDLLRQNPGLVSYLTYVDQS